MSFGAFQGNFRGPPQQARGFRGPPGQTPSPNPQSAPAPQAALGGQPQFPSPDGGQPTPPGQPPTPPPQGGFGPPQSVIQGQIGRLEDRIGDFQTRFDEGHPLAGGQHPAIPRWQDMVQQLQGMLGGEFDTAGVGPSLFDFLGRRRG